MKLQAEVRSPNSRVLPCIQPPMAIEQVKPNKPSFGLVVALAAVALIVIFVAAGIIVTVRAHSKKKPPFSRNPTSQLSLPGSFAPRTGALLAGVSGVSAASPAPPPQTSSLG